jgi:hypothetical protein
MLGKVRGHCRDHRPPGHPALPGLSGTFHTRATHRPRTTGPAAGARVLNRQSRACPRAFSNRQSRATPLGLLAPVCPHFALALPPSAVLPPRPGPTARVATRPARGASARRSVPRSQPNSAAIMTIRLGSPLGTIPGHRRPPDHPKPSKYWHFRRFPTPGSFSWPEGPRLESLTAHQGFRGFTQGAPYTQGRVGPPGDSRRDPDRPGVSLHVIAHVPCRPHSFSRCRGPTNPSAV